MNKDEFSYLKPRNPYAMSKWLVDNLLFTLPTDISITGLRYFNVWGPGEERKGNMTSFMTKNLESFRTGNEVKLLKLKSDDFSGLPARDFVYINDVCKVTTQFIMNRKSGIYNVGTGVANTWEDMCAGMYGAFGHNSKISYVEPVGFDLSGYQYYTKADISKLRQSGYSNNFMTVKQACEDYVRNIQ
jgi:ADP-L-glycero-D-manno-heptose 6-epimerase